MKERSIRFSAPMVLAILEGRKTQTRRIVKPVGNDEGFIIVDRGNGEPWPFRSDDDDGDSLFHTVKRGCKEYLEETPHACPYGQPGDRLWVREAFRFLDAFDGDSPIKVGDRCLAADYPKPWAPTQYEADGWRDNWMNVGATPGSVTPGKLRPGIHMPRWASRILLEVTGVRVDRLNEISHTDAMAEGMAWDDAIYDYSRLWENLNGPGSWDLNPWVWVVEFKKVGAGGTGILARLHAENEALRKDAARYKWAVENPDRAASIFEHLGTTHFDSEIDRYIGAEHENTTPSDTVNLPENGEGGQDLSACRAKAAAKVERMLEGAFKRGKAAEKADWLRECAIEDDVDTVVRRMGYAAQAVEHPEDFNDSLSF